MDRAAIYTSILRRNALRRDAKLPLLDVQETYRREIANAEWAAVVEKHYARVTTQILEEERALYADFGNSWGGKVSVHLRTLKTLRERYMRQEVKTLVPDDRS